MAPILLKPENALKRVEELIHVNQRHVALQDLHELIMSRKFKYLQINVEPIMLKYVELTVDLRKGKMAREALSHFRHLYQNQNISIVETVITHFLDYSDTVLKKAISEFSEVSVEAIEDLEEYETMEDWMLRTIYGSAEDAQETSEKVSLSSCLRFRLYVFRICLELTKNNAKLEVLAQNIAKGAFDFCRTYHRKNEFRRLSEMLRNHLQTIIKSSGSSNIFTINIHSPESAQLLIEVRCSQLNTAVHLELWQEAFRSIEDLHGLFILYKKGIKNSLMINYYECLVRIFQMSGDALFYSAAWNKLISFIFSQPEAPPEDKLKVYCSSAVLAALAVTSDEDDMEKLVGSQVEDIDEEHGEDTQISPVHASAPVSSYRDTKMTALLGLTEIPTRSALISAAASKVYMPFVLEDVKVLYDLMVTSSPISDSDLVSFFASCKKLSAQADMQGFLPSLQDQMAMRYLQQISLMTASRKEPLSFEKLNSLMAGFNLPCFYHIEEMLLRLNEIPNMTVLARLDHRQKLVWFEHSVKYVADVTSIESSDMSEMMSVMNTLMDTLLGQQSTDTADVPELMQRLVNRSEFERLELVKRQEAYDRRREALEQSQMKREQEEHAARLVRLQEEREADKLRRTEESKRKNLERAHLERERMEKQEKRRLIDEVNRKLSAVKKQVDVDSMIELSKAEILREQARLLDEAKKEIDRRFSSIGKRMDHKERAYRLEERPMLQKQSEQQILHDQANAAKLAEEKRKVLKTKHDVLQSMITRARHVSSDAAAFLTQWKASRQAGQASHLAELEENRISERQKLHDEILDQRYKEALKKEKEAEIRRLDEQAVKQREKEAEIERRLEEAKKGSLHQKPSQESHPSVSPYGQSNILPQTTASTNVSTNPSSGKFVPSFRKRTAAS